MFRIVSFWPKIFGAVFVLLSAISVAHAGPVVLAPGSTVAGKTIGEWTADWWKWAFAQSVPNDAFTDSSGINANVSQSGPVFFVAGTAGGNFSREFTVPEDKYLLIPLLNYEDSQLEQTNNGNPGITEAELEQSVHSVVTDYFDSLFAEIDGIAVPNLFDHREASPKFNFTTGLNNPFGLPGNANSGFAFADGYYLMLAPLGAGTKTKIEFGGGASEFDFAVRVTDNITGVPEPSILALFAGGVIPGTALYLRRRRSLS